MGADMVGGLASSFARLQSLLLHTDGTQAFLDELTRVAALLAEPALSCGVTLRRDGHPMTVASSDEQAAALDETQYSVGEGPCMHALLTGEPVWMGDLGTDDRWPRYRHRAQAQGLQCSYSLPLTADGVTVGAMNIYDFATPRVLTAEVRRYAELFAAQASGALQLTLGRADEAETRDQLEQALSSRTVIDQAIGILIGQQRCTAEEAFALLRMRSSASQTKLRDVAAGLIARVSGRPPQPGKPFDTA